MEVGDLSDLISLKAVGQFPDRNIIAAYIYTVIIEIDINANTINIKVSDEELAERRKGWTPIKKDVKGYLARYAALVTSADKGAILSTN